MDRVKTFSVEGALVAYTLVGTGDLLVLIPGANGTGEIFALVAKFLEPHFTVCTYDRRGFSNSKLTAEQNYEPAVRLARDADDVGALILKLSPDKSAYIMGTSSGAIVGQEVLRRHPDKIKKLIIHEPPLVKMLGQEGGEQMQGFYQNLLNQYRTNGLEVAVQAFLSVLPPSPDTEVMQGHMLNPRGAENIRYWFEHELTSYPAIQPDIVALTQLKDKFVVAVGSDTEGPLKATSSGLAIATGASLERVPGGHLGYALQAQGFAQAMQKILLGPH